MPASDTPLLPLLQALEVELHRPAARGDAARLDALLHDDFREFGRSGAVYTKADLLSQLPAQAQHAVVVPDRFEVRRLGEFAALLTYRSARRLADGTLERWTLRTSVWERSAHGWQMRFHQGTPAAPGGSPGLETPTAPADGAPSIGAASA
ncbi:nuclear transport factor 2 family protein [Acidovorax sp. NCPPB 3576]|uniref:nuclear transport factor 2 family protein n=1 Tax=Acidovorax sp. NCPPB 3576 TaxID=2940488 RepID=UPI0023495357|nr:nuclear transport factor 2 family protein [Acidovorax sp. NCPPB 3576]WCM89619.1 nuclear transport factor 2 family protein [Acidovorax sp. NCPPB 3576]